MIYVSRKMSILAFCVTRAAWAMEICIPSQCVSSTLMNNSEGIIQYCTYHIQFFHQNIYLVFRAHFGHSQQISSNPCKWKNTASQQQLISELKETYFFDFAVVEVVQQYIYEFLFQIKSTAANSERVTDFTSRTSINRIMKRYDKLRSPKCWEMSFVLVFW